MTLYINTQDPKVVTVSLKDGDRILESVSEKNRYGSQVLLPLINTFLASQGRTLQELAGIEVETGPGSFTGLRVGVSIANALGYILGIKVNGKKIETELRY